LRVLVEENDPSAAALSAATARLSKKAAADVHCRLVPPGGGLS
jgi:hypothetical protein